MLGDSDDEGGVVDSIPPEVVRAKGRYKQSSFLGSGTYGCVYRGIDVETGDDVVLKVMRRVGSQNAKEAAAMALLEVQNHHLCSHPGNGVIELLGVVPGGSLTLVLPPMEADAAALPVAFPDGSPHRHISSIFRQLLQALHYIHERGVIHNDVKLSNILLRRDGTVFLTDFGSSVRSTGPTPLPRSTLHYQSIESLMGGSATSAADMWSAGMCLAHLWKGVLPNNEATTELSAILAAQKLSGWPPTSTEWPDWEALPALRLAASPTLSREALDTVIGNSTDPIHHAVATSLRGLLTFPALRASAAEALRWWGSDDDQRLTADDVADLLQKVKGTRRPGPALGSLQRPKGGAARSLAL